MAELTAKGPITITTTAALRAAIAAGHTIEEIVVAAPDMDAIRAAARAEATEAERARVTGLQAIRMRGFEKEIAAAIASGASVEATAIAITNLAAERGVTVDQLHAEAPRAAPHGGKAPAEPGARAGSVWDKIKNRANEKQKKLRG